MTTPARRSATASAGERKLVTMLFADLSGYTALAESLDPEEVYSFLRPTMLELQRVVESFGGSVPQIQGDGFMAVFGVPTAHEDDGERAVRAALAVRDHVQALNEGRAGLSFPQVHAGVNSGEVMVGPSEEASGYTVMGDTVNTASRMADLATAGHVLVDASTRTLTASSIRYGPRRMRKAKGKAEPIATFEALGPLARDPASARGGAFVDREEFFALFGRELEGTEADGCSRVVVLTGEPGIGKSRLAQELGSSLAPGRFLLGRCAPFGERRLSSLAEVVACALGVGTGTAVDATRAAIERVARRIARTHHLSVTPDLRSLLGVDDPSRSRRSDRDIMRATRLVIEDAARLGTVAVVLDDLQWADASIDELLADARRNPWPAPVLLLGLSREPIAGLAATPLPGLDVGSMRTLAESLLGEPGSADSVGVPLDRANGNALFLEEMVGMLVEHGAVRHDADGWRLTDPEAVHEVPASIRLVIAARLDGLPADQKRVLHDASVCGAVVWGSLLEQLSDVPDPRAITAGARAARAAAQAPAQFDPRHHRVRVEARADPRRRLRLAAQGGARPAPRAGRGMAACLGAGRPRTGGRDRVPLRARVGVEPRQNRPGAERGDRGPRRRVPHPCRRAGVHPPGSGRRTAVPACAADHRREPSRGRPRGGRPRLDRSGRGV